MLQYIGTVGVDNRVWRIYAIFSSIGSLELIQMTWGVAAVRQFAPGEEHDTLTKAGAGVVSAVLALADDTTPQTGENEQLVLIERC